MPTTKGVSLKKRIEILQKVAQDFGQRSFCLKPDLSKAQTNDANTNMRIRFDVDEITLYSNDDLTFYNWADVSQDGVFLVLSPEIRINLTNWLVVSDGQEYISVRIEDENKEQVFHAIKDSPFWNKTVTCLSEDRKQVAEVMVDKQGLHINGVLYDVQYYINRNGCGIKSRLGFGLSSQNLGILKGESKFGGDYVPADGVSQAEYDSQLKKYEKALNSFDKKKSFWHKKSLTIVR